ncbi:hypothetical protein [Streptomyces scopuliridis]|uniref:hypothetical protein n=1 Tax=Streptomyces scopuliridis TaxID=452529 RepID=UPI0036A248F8
MTDSIKPLGFGHLGELRLPVADVRHTINTGRDQAADGSLSPVERETAWRDAMDSQSALHASLTELAEAARARGEAEGEREDREDLSEQERDRASDLRIAYYELVDDLRRAASRVQAHGIPRPGTEQI